MRWDNLRLDDMPASERHAEAPVPLFARGAVTRTFDTPGFRGMTFYEVQAKSIVSRVPESSHVPFRWTINPYRGCQHACSYCIWGETPILMANGRTKPIAEVRVGDKIYGTVKDGFYRHYTVTTVLAHWSTVKPAYRITLEDGTQLVASGEHRFLTERGWKHVTGAEQGPLQRPFLTVNSKLMGTGGFAEGPQGLPGLPTRLSVRNDSRGCSPRQPQLCQRRCALVPTRTHGFRGTHPDAPLPWRNLRDTHQGVRLRRGYPEAPGGTSHPDQHVQRRAGDKGPHKLAS
jgi:hypothetical protein